MNLTIITSSYCDTCKSNRINNYIFFRNKKTFKKDLTNKIS